MFGCHGNELPIKEILYQSVFGDKYYMIGHKFTISVTMDVSPFAWCLARAVLNMPFIPNKKLMTVMKFSRTNLLNCFVFCASLI